MSQIGEEILLVPFWCLIELALPAVPGCQCLNISQVQSNIHLKRKRWMDLNDYLSMAYLVVREWLCAFTDSSFLIHLFQPGWEERVHTDGRTFYIDHSKRTLCCFICNICSRFRVVTDVSVTSSSASVWLNPANGRIFIESWFNTGTQVEYQIWTCI